MSKINIVLFDDTADAFVGFKDRLKQAERDEFFLFNTFEELKNRGLDPSYENIINVNLDYIKKLREDIDVILIDDMWYGKSKAEEIINKVKNTLRQMYKNSDPDVYPLIFIYTSQLSLTPELLDIYQRTNINGVILRNLSFSEFKEFLFYIKKFLSESDPTKPKIYFQKDVLQKIVPYIIQGKRNFSLIFEILKNFGIQQSYETAQAFINLMKKYMKGKEIKNLYDDYLPLKPLETEKKEVSQRINTTDGFLREVYQFLLDRVELPENFKSFFKEKAKNYRRHIMRLLLVYSGILLWDEIN